MSFDDNGSPGEDVCLHSVLSTMKCERRARQSELRRLLRAFLRLFRLNSRDGLSSTISMPGSFGRIQPYLRAKPSL